MNSRLRIVVTGIIGQHPMLGGVGWDYVQYVLGLVELGHDAFYVEDSGEWPYATEKNVTTDNWITDDCGPNLRHLASAMAQFALNDRWAYRFPRSGEWFGLSDRQRRELVTSADLVLNVSGTIARPRKYLSAKRLAYIDSDPVFTQVRLAHGERKLSARVAAHDVHFSFGESLSDLIPKTAQHWWPTRQPIVLSQWRPTISHRPVFTTVMNWTSYKPLMHADRLFGQKDTQFLRYLDLPRRVPAALEVALGQHVHTEWQSNEKMMARHPGSARPVPQILQEAGWRVADAIQACGNLDSYRDYIEGSMGEWSVAKHGYVSGQPGWFSCRSACYLAAGKPVILENTGFDRVLPVGEGILSFRNVEEAAAAIEEVQAHYARHAATARDIAETWFDSRKVLSALIERAMNAPAIVEPRVAALERKPQILPNLPIGFDAPAAE
jgi:hypothetical protein